jgi:uncharacterized protein with ATP-grasp and redox domains
MGNLNTVLEMNHDEIGNLISSGADMFGITYTEEQKEDAIKVFQSESFNKFVNNINTINEETNTKIETILSTPYITPTYEGSCGFQVDDAEGKEF